MWAKNSAGQWMRPLEMLEMVLSADAALHLNSAPVFRVQDGILTQVRVSTLLIQHTCPPTPEEIEAAYDLSELAEEMRYEPSTHEATPAEIEADYIREVVLPREARERAERKEADRREAMAIVASRKAGRLHMSARRADTEQTSSTERRLAKSIQRHGEYIQAFCPRCKSQPGLVCINASAIYADGKRADDPRRYNQSPHQERVDYAVGSGVVDLREAEVQDYVPRPQVYVGRLAPQLADDQVLRRWLGDNSELWRPENWATTSLLDQLPEALA